MHNTLASLVERALQGNHRPLEFYLREQSHLPGPRANLELVNDLCQLLAALTPAQPDNVRSLLNHLLHNHHNAIECGPPSEFVILCGVVAFGACAAVRPEWRGETFEFLTRCANNPSWRVQEGVALAFQRLLPTSPQETLNCLTHLAFSGNYFEQRIAITAIAEPAVLNTPELIAQALVMQQVILKRLHLTPATERKREDFRALRKTLGYTVSVVTAATLEAGFALMRECATWGDADI